MLAKLDGLIWMIGMLVALVYLQRRLHFEFQAVFLLLTRRADISLALFSILFLPGVFIHEVSHLLMARLLGVKTGRFSIVPQTLPDGRLQLGYVETAGSDFIRDGLIGLAPLMIGGGLVGYVGLVQLNLLAIWSGVGETVSLILWRSLTSLPSRPDFWLWFYLLFTVSSTMLPSKTDRRAWLSISFFIILVLILAFIVGAGPWMITSLAPKVNQFLRVLALVLTISVSMHLLLFPPLWLLRKLISHILRLQAL